MIDTNPIGHLMPVVGVHPEFGNVHQALDVPLARRLHDTFCLCGKYIGLDPFVVLPLSGSHAHLPCADKYAVRP
jgi:hypothetical protein